MKYKDRADRIIDVVAILAIILMIAFWFYRDSSEIFDGGDEVYDYGVNLALGVIISYIFFYLNILYPKKKNLAHTLKYVGECIGTICFNEITRIRVFENDAANLKVMNIMGVKFNYINGIEGQRPSIQRDINKQNIGLLTNLLDVLEKNAFSSRTVVVELMNSLFPMITEDYVITECFTNCEDEKSKLINMMSCKRYSETGNIRYVTKAAIGRLNYLLENEANMHSINSSIEFGDS